MGNNPVMIGHLKKHLFAGIPYCKLKMPDHLHFFFYVLQCGKKEERI